MRFALIDRAKAEFPIHRLCNVLGVSQSGYFAWEGRPACRRQRDDMVLLAHVRSAFALSNGTHGSPPDDAGIAGQRPHRRSPPDGPPNAGERALGSAEAAVSAPPTATTLGMVQTAFSKSMHSSRARASDSPAGPYLPNVRGRSHADGIGRNRISQWGSGPSKSPSAAISAGR